MSVRLRVLNAVLNSSCPIDANEIARRAVAKPRRVRVHLTMLYREELVDRRPSGRKGSRAFIYFPKVGAESRWEKERAKGGYEDDLPGDRDVDAAIERNRERWRVGERFTREEVERFRKEQRGRRRHGIIRT